ncbi:MAG: ABC transporter substrate-binding protein [Chloroflexi bacterium]|nr:ABC transporter substrate-binding protein [Chloroflexota bacterium]
MHRTLVLGASLTLLVGSVAVGEASSPDIRTAQASTAPASSTPGALPSGPVGDGIIRIGSAGFYEAVLVAEMYAQAIEGAGLSVERKLGIGPREVTWAAMGSGSDINLMPEYIGSLLETINGNAGEASGDADATREALAARLAAVDMSVFVQTPAVDTNAFVVTAQTAQERGLTTISDLAPIAGELKWALPPECATNPLCGGALLKYGIDVTTLDVTEIGACGGPMATAIVTGAVHVGELCSTQPDIAQNGLVVLVDDLATQPADALAPVVRNDLLRALEAQGVDLAAILDPVSASITTEELTALNVRVGVDQEDVDVVAREYLVSKGLLPAAP